MGASCNIDAKNKRNRKSEIGREIIKDEERACREKIKNINIKDEIIEPKKIDENKNFKNDCKTKFENEEKLDRNKTSKKEIESEEKKKLKNGEQRKILSKKKTKFEFDKKSEENNKKELRKEIDKNKEMKILGKKMEIENEIKIEEKIEIKKHEEANEKKENKVLNKGEGIELKIEEKKSESEISKRKNIELIKSEVFTGHKSIPIKILLKMQKSICKITMQITKDKIKFGTGFFLNYSNSLKCLITNYHNINPHSNYENTTIEIWNKKKMKLTLNNRFTKFLDKPRDFAVIEIKESDNIYEYIKFLYYDKNYIDQGYKIYQNADVFTIEHPYGNDASCSSGKIINIHEFEFNHNISTDNGSSGCPILLLNNSINLIRVIGIHKNADYSKKINGGTFIGEIFDEVNEYIEDPSDISMSQGTNQINNNLKKINENVFMNQIINQLYKNINLENINNVIFAEIEIKDKDVNKDIRIINSYEEYLRTGKNSKEFKKIWIFNNEDDIKNCEISIDNKPISFNYFHKFDNKGKYLIKYFFKNNPNNLLFMFAECNSLIFIDFHAFDTKTVNEIGCLFYECTSLKSIDLTNFRTQNVINMNNVFYKCFSLKNLNLSNFNTQNVKSMKNMFAGCQSLKNLDLSNFNTENVTNMSGMFNGCKFVENIDLFNFNTENVTDMSEMFDWCRALKKIDLSSFNTKNVTDMSEMFFACTSLKSIDLSNFNTQNVLDMYGMFAWCYSLTHIDLSNFTTREDTNISFMFFKCSVLTEKNSIINDKRISNNLSSLCSIF